MEKKSEFSAYALNGLPPLFKLFGREWIKNGRGSLTEGTLDDIEFSKNEEDALEEFIKIPIEELRIILKYLYVIEPVLCKKF